MEKLTPIGHHMRTISSQKPVGNQHPFRDGLGGGVITRKRARPAPVTISDQTPRGDVIIPTTVVPSRGLAAGHDPRYQCADGEKPWGAGFSEIGIGRNIYTGRPW